ncbi:MAG: hypothetical protein PHY93_02690 [Bacteriovorax sp.]|nr:hypothetical protein [Bacteriovorax sp.]
MKILFLIIILSTKLHAENVPLPASVSGVDEIVSEFRNQFATKIIDLGKNYISTITNESLIFTNSEALKCNGGDNIAGEQLASIQYTYKKQKTAALLEKVTYTGCSSEISLIEEVTTTGTNLEPLKFSDIIKGKRSIDLKDNELSRYYKISNGDGDEIFSVIIEKKDNLKLLSFSILGQKFLTMNFEYKNNTTRVVFTYFGYNASYSRQHAGWSMKNNFTEFTNTVIAKKAEFVTYLDRDGNRISLSNFINSFNQTVMDSAIKTIGSIIEYHTYYFPPTEATKTGSQSQRFIDEIRVAQNRITANTEISLVKKLLQDLLNAAELGQIIDNRPKNN